jgi:hypoxanthine-DNA glycosylase
MSAVTGFPPIATVAATTLILGSMPGAASLAAGEYYAHPRNHFWRIAAEIFDFDPLSAYECRVDALNASGVALWDVLQSCVRPGSLDSRIESSSLVTNNFEAFFESHPDISLVGFNGAKAEKLYSQRVLRASEHRGIRRVLLPSTSPAHAAMTFDRKLLAWRQALSEHRQVLSV